MRQSILFQKLLKFQKIERNYSHKSKQYQQSCSILGVKTSSNLDDIHNAFIKLAKRFHPDSGTKEANADKFKQVETAYRYLKNNPITNDNIESEAVKEEDIKHVAPQHRQYLSYDGVSGSSPYQRQQEYAKLRAMRASDNVLQHRINKQAVTAGDKQLKPTSKSSHQRTTHKIKTKFGIDRIVEDLIQESMSKGEFNNLPGSGKPLKNQSTNPYVDFTTHKLNQVLIENGFTPEWISLQKEIREKIKNLKRKLSETFENSETLEDCDNNELWLRNMLNKYIDDVDEINKKINYYNLIVPILQKQMVAVNLLKIGKELISKEVMNRQCRNFNRMTNTSTKTKASKSNDWTSSRFLNLIGSFIRL